MMRLTNARISLSAIWISFVLIVLGSYFRNRAPLFDEWTRYIHSQLGDVPGIGLALGLSIPFVAVVDFFLSTAMTIGLLTMWRLAKKRYILARAMALILGIAFGFVFWRTCTSILENFRWLFYVLAFGELVRTVGIFFGLMTPVIAEGEP